MNLVPVPLGWSPRAGATIFASAPFSAPALSGTRRGLGETEQQWFARAKAAVAIYDSLVERARKIASPPVRESILSRYAGDPRDQEGALYRRNSVAYNAAEAESYTPVNYLVFQPDRVRNRVEKLEDWNRDLEEEVKAAEKTYGLLPEPVVSERIIERQIPTMPGNDWTVPLLVGGVLLAGVAILVFRD